MKTLVYHYGALGDFITILPLLKNWKKHTDSQITLLGKPAFGRLAKQFGYIEDIIDADSRNYLPLFYDAENDLSGLLKEFSTAILFADENSFICKNLKRQFHGELLHQAPFPRSSMHIIDCNLQLINKSEMYAIPELLIDAPQKINTERVIVIHPGSGSSQKNWPFEYFLTVADNCRAIGYTIIWLSGPAEKEFDYPKFDKVYKNFSLLELVNLFSRSSLYIGNDSGITHLAAASNCKILAIFGPSDPQVWSPRGKNHITVVYHKRNCSPCHLKKQPRSCKLECLRNISPDEIFQSVQEILK